MENQKHNKITQDFHQYINRLIESLSPQRIKIFLTAQNDNFRQALISYGTSFVQIAQKKVIICKRKILLDILDIYVALRDQQVNMIKNSLKSLILPTQNIIRDEILNIYSGISELRQKNLQKRQTCELLDKIQQNLEPLLRDHFILKQVQKMDSKYNSNSLKLILSQKRINMSEDSLSSINSQQSIKQAFSDQALKRIQKQIQCKSIQKLITQQLKGEQSQINEGLQTCRICKNNYKLKDILRHVDYCSKVQSYSSRRDQILIEQIDLIKQIQDQITHNNQNQDENINNREYFLELNKLHQLIIDTFQKKPNLLRRNSAYHHNQRRLSKKLAQQIEKYLKIHNNQTIQLFKQLSRERELIEKKITSLQNNFLYHRNQASYINNSVQIICPNSSKKISKSIKTAKLMKICTKKSIFARQSDNSQTYSQRISDQINKTQQFDLNYNQMSVEYYEDSQKQILCKSLSHFTFKDEINRSQISIEDFQILSFLGKGAFGKVYLVRRKQTKDIYALKVIKILESWKQNQLNSIKNQHDILSKIAGQHLVKAPFSFTEGFAHFFVFQYMPGGDLGKVIEQQTYLNFKQSQFYLAEIVLAIEHLHNMGIIHRDLKPENLIFDQNSHLKLTDFGLSQFRINDKLKRARRCRQDFQSQIETKNGDGQKKGKQKSILIQGKTKIKVIGTPDYIAPEIISGQSLDNLSIDWWSLGVIAYQMMIGCRPFCANTIEQVFKNIEQLSIQWPQIGEQENMISQVAVDFIKRLLNKNFNQRLGSNSISQIKQHQFFKGIDWQEIKHQEPPLKLNLNLKQKFYYSEQVPELRAQIINAIGKNVKAKSTFKLENFVRYDILVEETLQSADRQIVKRSTRIKRLKSIASNFSNQIIYNKQDSNISEPLSEDDARKSWKTIQKII